MKDLKQHIRPFPYYSTCVTDDERWLAKELRREFVPKIDHTKNIVTRSGRMLILCCAKKYINYI